MEVKLDAVNHGDCVKGIQKLDEGSVDLVFADPPFNIGYEYDVYDDHKDYDKYLTWSRDWIKAVHRVLKPDGTFWLAIGDEHAAELKLIAENRYPGLPICTDEPTGKANEVKARLGRPRSGPGRTVNGPPGFFCRSWVIWYFTFGVNCKMKFSRSHTHLFHFVKDRKRFTFNAAKIRIKSARQLVYKDKRQNPDGRLPDDVWIQRRDFWIQRPQDQPEVFPPDGDCWYFSRVAGTFNERQGWHGCQMPERLLGRIIEASSNRGDLVLDPFVGSGTTLVVAKKLRREYVGFELSEEYAQQARERLAAAKVDDDLNGPSDPLTSAPRTGQNRNAAAKRKTGRKRSTSGHLLLPLDNGDAVGAL